MAETATCPVNGCDITVDLVLQAADGVKFGAHKLNLQTYADGFPVTQSVMADSADDIPVLEESSAVLRLMLRFMHHTLQPDLEDFPFKTVAAFADAAEKYFIFSAIGMCKMYMLQHQDEYPVTVFAYACKNNHINIANKSAPLTVDCDATTIAESLGPSHMLNWFMYREYWLKRREGICNYVHPAPQLHKGGLEECELWEPFVAVVKKRLYGFKDLCQLEKEEMVIIMQEIYRLQQCIHCTRRAEYWIQKHRTSSMQSSTAEAPMYSEL